MAKAPAAVIIMKSNEYYSWNEHLPPPGRPEPEKGGTRVFCALRTVLPRSFLPPRLSSSSSSSSGCRSVSPPLLVPIPSRGSQRSQLPALSCKRRRFRSAVRGGIPAPLRALQKQRFFRTIAFICNDAILKRNGWGRRGRVAGIELVTVETVSWDGEWEERTGKVRSEALR